MAKIVGVGGVFLKSADPAALQAWYRDVLGIPLQKYGGARFVETGTAEFNWMPFAADTTYFAPSTREVMINLRVDDLDAFLAEVRARGGTPLDRRQDESYGKFGYIVDPDGTLIELYQPVAH